MEKEGGVMKNSLKQEIFKFQHQRIPLYGVIALVILMLYSAFSQSHVTRKIIAQGLGAGQWITIIMITIASTFMAMEYQNRTIMTLFYKNSHKSLIYFTKMLVITFYGLFLVVMSVILTFILKAFMVGSRFSWSSTVGQHSLLLDLILNAVGTFVYILFIVTLAFLLIVLIRVNAAVVGIGLAIGFLGSGFSSVIMDALPNLITILRWNPLNMIIVINQLANGSFAKYSSLNSVELIIANLVYAIFFSIIGDIVFKNRRV